MTTAVQILVHVPGKIVDHFGKRVLKLILHGMILRETGIAIFDTSPRLAGMLLIIVGTAVIISGFRLYAKARGRSAAWGFLGIYGSMGLILLLLLKNGNVPAGEASGFT